MASRDPDPHGSRKEQLERRIARKMARFLRDQRDRLADKVTEQDAPQMPTDEFWQGEREMLQSILREELASIAAEFGEIELVEIFRRRQLDQIGPEDIRREAIAWAITKGSELAEAMTSNTAKTLATELQKFFSTPGFTIGDLAEGIKDIPAISRANAAAVTEVTRSAAKGQEITAGLIRDEGFRVVDVWNTNNDGRVCPICAPRHRTTRGDGWDSAPPAHVNCRCWLTSKLEGVQIEDQPVSEAVLGAAAGV